MSEGASLGGSSVPGCPLAVSIFAADALGASSACALGLRHVRHVRVSLLWRGVSQCTPAHTVGRCVCGGSRFAAPSPPAGVVDGQKLASVVIGCALHCHRRCPHTSTAPASRWLPPISTLCRLWLCCRPLVGCWAPYIVLFGRWGPGGRCPRLLFRLLAQLLGQFHDRL